MSVKEVGTDVRDQRVRLHFKTKSDISDWTFAQVVQLDVSRRGDLLDGIFSEAGEFKIHHMEKGRPTVGVYFVNTAKSTVSGKVGGPVQVDLWLTKSKKMRPEGGRYCPTLPYLLRIKGVLEPDWKEGT